MSKNIKKIAEAMAILNSERLEEYDFVTITYEHEYYIEIELTQSKPYTPVLYKKENNMGIYWNYFEDLMYHNGLFLDDEEHSFLEMVLV